MFPERRYIMLKQKTFYVEFQKFEIVFIKTMIFTQKMVHADSNVYFKIVTQNGQISFWVFKVFAPFFVPRVNFRNSRSLF